MTQKSTQQLRQRRHNVDNNTQQQHKTGNNNQHQQQQQQQQQLEKPTRKRQKYATAALEKATSAATHRRWTRAVIIFAVMTLVYFYVKNRNQQREVKFAPIREIVALRTQNFPCSSSYQSEIKSYPKCVPRNCGRFVTDILVDAKESDSLLDLAKRILTKTKTTGGAAILDIHTGALSYKEEFVNVYSIDKLRQEIHAEHLNVYNLVKGKIQQAIAQQFQIDANQLYLTYPTFFSRLTNETAKTVHDEYWHEHVDKETYPSFHYTSLLYLNNYNKDFKGGRFLYVDGNPADTTNQTKSAIEPKRARINAFTSGAENRHFVEKVESGERYAVTISFTCDQKLAIKNPEIQKSNGNAKKEGL